MSLEEIKKRKNELNEELEKLNIEQANLEQEKFREKIGRYFRFNVESVYNGYIKITDIYKGVDSYVVEGVWFKDETRKARKENMLAIQGCRRLHIKGKVTSWNDFHLTEINEEEFIKAFNKAIDTEKQLFIKFIK